MGNIEGKNNNKVLKKPQSQLKWPGSIIKCRRNKIMKGNIPKHMPVVWHAKRCYI